MKARQTIKSLLFAAVALGAMALQSASASTYGFMNITNNGNSDLSSQLSVEVLAVGTQGVFQVFEQCRDCVVDHRYLL
jgi:hypothetical protein